MCWQSSPRSPTRSRPHVSEPAAPHAEDLPITPEMDRWNGRLFLLCYALMYLAAPVIYVGVVQAALCDKLGASATVANLPSATYLLGGVAPLLCSLVFPHRLDRTLLVWCNGLTAALLGLIWVSLSAGLAQ